MPGSDLPPRPTANPAQANTAPTTPIQSAAPAAETPTQPMQSMPTQAAPVMMPDPTATALQPTQALQPAQVMQPQPMPAPTMPLAQPAPVVMPEPETQTTTVQQPTSGTTQVIVNQTIEQKNNIGLAGFIIALIDLIFSWAPFANWVLWLVGLILSLIGLTKKPKGFAIAGTIISCIDIIIILIIISAGLAILSSF